MLQSPIGNRAGQSLIQQGPGREVSLPSKLPNARRVVAEFRMIKRLLHPSFKRDPAAKVVLKFEKEMQLGCGRFLHGKKRLANDVNQPVRFAEFCRNSLPKLNHVSCGEAMTSSIARSARLTT